MVPKRLPLGEGDGVGAVTESCGASPPSPDLSPAVGVCPEPDPEGGEMENAGWSVDSRGTEDDSWTGAPEVFVRLRPAHINRLRSSPTLPNNVAFFARPCGNTPTSPTAIGTPPPRPLDSESLTISRLTVAGQVSPCSPTPSLTASAALQFALKRLGSPVWNTSSTLSLAMERLRGRLGKLTRLPVAGLERVRLRGGYVAGGSCPTPFLGCCGGVTVDGGTNTPPRGGYGFELDPGGLGVARPNV